MFSLTYTVSCLPMLSFAAPPPPDSASAGGYFLLNRCFSFLLLFSPEYCRITYSSPYSLKHLEATALNIPGKQKTKNYLVAEESCVSSSMVGFTVIR